MILRKLLICIFLCLTGFDSLSQQVILKGQVSVFNSRYNTGIIRYVKGAFVTAAFSKPSRSDDSGRFQLEFVTVPIGTATKVEVESNGYFVVNERELDRVTVGSHDILRVYLALQGQLARAQTDLYNISRKSLYAYKDSTIKRLYSNLVESKEVIRQLSLEFGLTIKDRQEAESLLNAKVEELEGRLPQVAQYLASQNLDFASALYVTAYEKFRSGDIEKVITLLGDSVINQSYKSAVESVKKGREFATIGQSMQESGIRQIRQVIDEHALRGNAFQLVFRFADAAREFVAITKIYEDNSLDEHELAAWHSHAAEMFMLDGQYAISLGYQKKARIILEHNSWSYHLDLGSCYDNMALTHELMFEFDEALPLERKLLNILQGNSKTSDRFLANCYGHIGYIFKKQRQYDSALFYQNHSLSILMAMKRPVLSDLVNAHNNIGLTLSAKGNGDQAVKELLLAIGIAKKMDKMNDSIYSSTYYNPDGTEAENLSIGDETISSRNLIRIQSSYQGDKKPTLFVLYDNLTSIFVTTGNYIEAAPYQHLATDLCNSNSILVSSDCARCFNNMAIIYGHLGKIDSAIYWCNRAIPIEEKVLDRIDPNLALLYDNIQGFYYSNRSYALAKKFGQKSLNIREIILSPTDMTLAETYHNVALDCAYLHDCPSAIILFKKEADILEKQTGQKSWNDLRDVYKDIETCFENLGRFSEGAEYKKKISDLDSKIQK